MKPSVEHLDWGTVDYSEALERQRELFERLVSAKSNCEERGDPDFFASGVADGALTERHPTEDSTETYSLGRAAEKACQRPDHEKAAGWIVLCEHPHVYTLGRSGQAGNLLVSEEFLRSKGASLHRTERGGDITYHGPGQIVGYPILDLERLGIGLREYIAALETAVIETVAHFGIEAGRVEGKTGVWIGGQEEINTECFRQSGDYATLGEKNEEGVYSVVNDRTIFETAEAESPLSRKPVRKICAIGVRASRGVVMHGFALNVATDLGWFDHINPCGFVGGAVTSLEQETGRKVEMGEVKKVLCERLFDNLKI